jgi:hypothetical protein
LFGCFIYTDPLKKIQTKFICLKSLKQCGIKTLYSYFFLMKKIAVWIFLLTTMFLFWCDKSPWSDWPENRITEKIENQGNFKWSIKDLLKKWWNITCSFTFENNETKEKWTVYLYGWKMKSIAQVYLKKENLDLETYTVIKDWYTYTRSNAQKWQWAKFKNIDDKWNDEVYTEDPLDNKNIDFICNKNEANDDMFELPTDIAFMDISDYLKWKKE